MREKRRKAIEEVEYLRDNTESRVVRNAAQTVLRAWKEEERQHQD